MSTDAGTGTSVVCSIAPMLSVSVRVPAGDDSSAESCLSITAGLPVALCLAVTTRLPTDAGLRGFERVPVAIYIYGRDHRPPPTCLF